MARRIFLGLLAIASAGLAIYVVVEAVIHDDLSRSVVYAVLPLLLLFGIAYKGLTDKRD